MLALTSCGGAAGATGTAHTFVYAHQPPSTLGTNFNGPADTHAYIAGFNVDTDAGALTPLSGSPFPAPDVGAIHGNPTLLATPDGHFLYLGACTDLPATGKADCTIVNYAVGSDGRLSERATQRVSGVDDMQIVASGKFMYMFDSQILRVQLLGYQVGSDGRLTPLPQVAPPTPGVIARIAVTPSGKFLYAAFYSQSSSCNTGGTPCPNLRFMAYSIDQNTGALTPVAGSPFATPLLLGENSPGDFAMTIDGQSRFMYLSGDTFLDVIALTIDPNTGALSSASRSLAKLQAITGTASPDGKFLFLGVANTVDGPGIAAYSIASSGALSPAPGSPVILDSREAGLGWPITLDPSGRFLLFLGGPGAHILEYSIASDGALDNRKSFGMPVPDLVDPERLVVVTRKP